MHLRTTDVVVPAGRRHTLRGCAGVCLALALSGAARAQEETPLPDATPTALRYARVEVDQQPVRCFPSEHSPLFVDQLARGAVVQLGEERDGFVAVNLPLGVTGYVHEKFATQPDDQGFVRSNGKRVSFRYRPRSNEAPAATLEDGAALHYMATEGDWYVVRNPRCVGYVPRAALSAELDPTEGAQGWSEFEAARRAEWEKVTGDRLAAREREKQLRELRERLQGVVAEFRAEASKPWNAQRRETFVAIEAAAGKLASEFESGSNDELTVHGLLKEVRKQILVLDAQAVATDSLPPPKLEVTVRKHEVEDPLARFDLVGWVRIVDSAAPTRKVRLVRGGRVLGYLTCSSDRYDFKMFEGTEIGVLGPKEASADGTWLLDVQRLDVLGVQTR